jgi:hypothetical protein
MDLKHIEVHQLKISECQKENPFVNTFSGYQNDVFLFCHKPVIKYRKHNDSAGAPNTCCCVTEPKIHKVNTLRYSSQLQFRQTLIQ